MTRIMINRYNPNWGSHMPLLIKIFEMSKGDVLELGMGPFSTPLLHVLCSNKERKLVSYETDPYYFERHKDFESELHEINFIKKDWEEINIEKKWGLVFVDQHPQESRGIMAKKVANLADFVVLHDSDPHKRDPHGYEKIYPLFKYRFDYKKLIPNTTVLSNFININELNI